METQVWQNVIYGFQIVLQPLNLFYCFVGVFVGTLIGVLPGLGPVATISLLLPSTFHVNPVSAIIMLAGIYYGAMYGGSTTSILVNIPGEAASVITCLDGYQMARKGRAGPALGISALGSFIGGTASIIGLMLLAPPLATIALSFGPPEYCALMLLGLMILTYLSSGSMTKALIMACLGILLGCIGVDQVSGVNRFVYDIQALLDGVGLIPVIMGLFGISEVLINLEQTLKERSVFRTELTGLWPTWEDWKVSLGAILRGTSIGFFLGILPGGGAIISSFAAYAVEKRVSRHPERFGTGVIEGVAAPETANNAACGSSFIPLLTLGIPANAVMAILMGALLIHGLTPGPLLMKKSPDLFWGVIASMYLGNLMLLLLNLPLIGLWVKLLRVPYPLLFPFVLLFCLIGSYSVNNSGTDVTIMVIFGGLGYFMRKFKYEGAPLVLALVLAPMLENAFRQSLLISNGSLTIFINRPISACLMALTAMLLFLSIAFRGRPGKKFEGEER